MILPKIHHALSELTIPSSNMDIQVRQILAKDEKLLLMAKTSEGPEAGQDILAAVRQVVNNCIVTPNIDLLKLPLFDTEYLFLRLRALSVTNIIKVAYQDNDELNDFYAYVNAKRAEAGLGPNDRWDISKLTKEEQSKLQPPPPYEFEVDLNKVEIHWPKNTEGMTLTVNDVTIELHYPYSELYTQKGFLQLKGAELLDFLLVNSIKSIKMAGAEYAPDSTPEELRAFLDELPMGSYDKLRGFLQDLPRLEYELTYKNKFGTEKKINLSTLSDFFTF